MPTLLPSHFLFAIINPLKGANWTDRHLAVRLSNQLKERREWSAVTFEMNLPCSSAQSHLGLCEGGRACVKISLIFAGASLLIN